MNPALISAMTINNMNMMNAASSHSGGTWVGVVLLSILAAVTLCLLVWLMLDGWRYSDDSILHRFVQKIKKIFCLRNVLIGLGAIALIVLALFVFLPDDSNEIHYVDIQCDQPIYAP